MRFGDHQAVQADRLVGVERRDDRGRQVLQAAALDRLAEGAVPPPLDRRQEDVGAVAEVAVDGALRDAGLGDDVVEGDLPEAAGDEQTYSRVEDVVAALDALRLRRPTPLPRRHRSGDVPDG
nr:hypothetical protein [Herbidospora mongoliensis]